MNVVDRLQHELRHNGHSVTNSRLLVCQTLAKHAPIGMREVITQLDGEVDRASIYRIIALFEELGIVRKIPIGWKYKLELSDKFTHHHHHAHCLSCKRIITLPEDKLLEQLIEKTAEKQGFAITDHHIELHGYCSNCQQKAP